VSARALLSFAAGLLCALLGALTGRVRAGVETGKSVV